MQFSEFRTELNNRMSEAFLNRLQSGILEAKAQKFVNEIFAQYRARSKVIEISQVGLHIVGCELGFNLGTIGVKKWLTKFGYDTYSVEALERDVVALGYCNQVQLYIKRGMLVARHGVAHDFESCTVGRAPLHSVLYIAQRRAAELGYT